MSYIPHFSRTVIIGVITAALLGAGLYALGTHLVRPPEPAPHSSQAFANIPKARPRYYVAPYALTWRRPTGFPTAAQDPTTIHRIGLRAWSAPTQVQLLTAIRTREADQRGDILSILVFPASEVPIAAWSLDWYDLTLPQSPQDPPVEVR